ncbi:flagellar motor switch protein FliM [Nitrospina gracilis]|uniref:flagellar motor switch protein FliM n=1 Tax=Nitrospina gracilis TaxID=35801 RepID=UPI001F02FD5B|nr:flagellar motor switch protein FliM [Nitrospina gracilis]MCF8720289.1 flagellar motor switch protein FliM [Nitrospina gracilis Nb-211]
MAQVLSKGEVDALLRGVSENQIEVEADITEEEKGVVPYDLTSQEKIIRGRLPTLEIINQFFSRLFRNSFSGMMRRSADVSTVSTDSLKFGDFLRSLPVPSSLHVFRMEPLRGFGLVVMESSLVFALVDNFFGGNGSSEMKNTGRDFTSIEMRMTRNVIQQALEDWANAWKPVHRVKTSYVRSEVNPQFAAIVPPTDVVLIIVFDIEMERASGTITICLPYTAIEPVLPKLKANFQSERMEADKVWIRRLREELMQTDVECVVELGKTIMTPRKLLQLRVGDTLMLGNDVSDPLTVKVEGIKKYMGHPGVSRGMKAVQISKIIEREE